MKSLKWEGIGMKNLFPHTSSVSVRVRLSVAHNHEPYQMAAPIVMPFGV